MQQISKNARRWGWGYSIEETGEIPQVHTGTLNLLIEKISGNKRYRDIVTAGIYRRRQWFYNNQPIEFQGSAGSQEYPLTDGNGEFEETQVFLPLDKPEEIE